MKKSDMLKAELNTLIAESKVLMNKDGATAEEISAKTAEISALKAKIALQEGIEAEEKAQLENEMKKTAEPVTAGTEMAAVDNKEEYTKAFYAAVAGQPLTAAQKELMLKNALSSTSGTDGGYLIPIDQQVAVKELMRDYGSLDQYVNIESVSTLTGSRNIEKEAEFTSFANLTEGGTIADMDTPQFTNIAYSIKDYAGILPVPNNLLNDAVGLQAHLMKWLAKKNVATRNAIIATLLNTLNKTAITNIDSVKTALNKTLDPAISASANCYIFMNQDSFDKFDKMKDGEDKPVLQPDVTNPTIMRIKGKQVVLLSNKTLATRTGTGADAGKKFAPVIIGNLKEVVTLFDRQAMSLLATNIGAGSFENNLTKYRAILRLDAKMVDTKAAVFGEIDVTA